ETIPRPSRLWMGARIWPMCSRRGLQERVRRNEVHSRCGEVHSRCGEVHSRCGEVHSRCGYEGLKSQLGASASLRTHVEQASLRTLTGRAGTSVPHNTDVNKTRAEGS